MSSQGAALNELSFIIIVSLEYKEIQNTKNDKYYSVHIFQIVLLSRVCFFATIYNNM